MTVAFTGTAVWRATISGPANTEDVTGPSVVDMGVLLADRTLFLYDAMADAFKIEYAGDYHIHDPTSAYGTQETFNLGAWTTSSLMVVAADIIPDDRLLVILQLNAEAVTANFAEFRVKFDAVDSLAAAIHPSPHVLIHTGPSAIPQAYCLTYLSEPIEEGFGTPLVCPVSMEARVDTPPAGSLNINGSAAMTVLRLRPHH